MVFSPSPPLVAARKKSLHKKIKRLHLSPSSFPSSLFSFSSASLLTFQIENFQLKYRDERKIWRNQSHSNFLVIILMMKIFCGCLGIWTDDLRISRTEGVAERGWDKEGTTSLPLSGSLWPTGLEEATILLNWSHSNFIFQVFVLFYHFGLLSFRAFFAKWDRERARGFR